MANAADSAGAVFGALSDPTRRALLQAIAARPETTATELASGLPISRQAVRKHLTALDIFAFDSSKQDTNVIASLTLVKILFEHFNTGNDNFLSWADTDDFNFFVDLDDTSFNTTSSNCATTLN